MHFMHAYVPQEQRKENTSEVRPRFCLSQPPKSNFLTCTYNWTSLCVCPNSGETKTPGAHACDMAAALPKYKYVILRTTDLECDLRLAREINLVSTF